MQPFDPGHLHHARPSLFPDGPSLTPAVRTAKPCGSHRLAPSSRHAIRGVSRD